MMNFIRTTTNRQAGVSASAFAVSETYVAIAAASVMLLSEGRIPTLTRTRSQ